MPRKAVVNSPGCEPLQMSPENVERFLEWYRTEQYPPTTLQQYKRNLSLFYRFLPEDKCIRQGAMEQWRDKLLQDGYTPRTVNTKLSAVQQYLEFFGQWEYRITERVPFERGPVPHPELTRNEYLRLLSAAKNEGKEQLYLLIKLLVCTGLPLPELAVITLETVQQGKLVSEAGGEKRSVQIPECLQKELLCYIKKEYRREGPLFVTKTGQPMDRGSVFRQLRQLCREAQVPEEKGNVRCLRKLYETTRSEVKANVSLLIEQAMDRIVEQEQLAVGWEDG
ncbi:MAG: site-specific integrase [Muribaculaceae bacterium]|nr:site-specific integrase [Muribaculaceae bacterium]